MTEDFFKKEMGKANKEDTFVSILVFTIASVLIFLINGFFQFQLITNFLQDPAFTQALQDEMLSFDLNVGMIFFYLLIGTVIFTPISFYMSVGLQFLGARIFGGKGKFKTHAYIIGFDPGPVCHPEWGNFPDSICAHYWICGRVGGFCLIDLCPCPHRPGCESCS